MDGKMAGEKRTELGTRSELSESHVRALVKLVTSRMILYLLQPGD